MAGNKRNGNAFEREFCEILSDFGFWVHDLTQNASGQPADIIAVRHREPYLIDCKLSADGSFALSRVEENQALAMDLWEQCGNGTGWFAIRTPDDIYMLSYTVLKHAIENGKKRFSKEEVEKSGGIEWWLRSQIYPLEQASALQTLPRRLCNGRIKN